MVTEVLVAADGGLATVWPCGCWLCENEVG